MTPLRWTIVIVILACTFLSVREFRLQPDGKTHVIFFDVGQGDSALITTPNGKRVLIDGGPDWSTLERLGSHMPFFDRSIDMVMLSHPNADHLMSLPEVLRRYDVQALATAGTAYEMGRYAATLSGAELSGARSLVLHAGQTIELQSGATITVLWPPSVMPNGMSKDVNNESLVLRFESNGKRVLFTGDMESIVEKTLVQARADVRADILKVAHHGSTSSSILEFLRLVDPDLAVISAGEGNPFGHPRPEILERLNDLGVEVRRTDLEGDIEVVW